MAFADNRFDTRRRNLASELASRRLDAMLLTNLTNIRYFSGFTGSNAALLIGRDRSARIATDGRYTTQIAAEVPDIEAIIDRRTTLALLEDSDTPRRVGVESAHLSMAAFERLTAAVPEDLTLVPVGDIVEPLRLVKDKQELAALKSVAELATSAFASLLERGGVAAGRTEREVAADLEYLMRTAGSERVSFDTIVASGPNSAKPHHGASDRVIEHGDLVTIDFGAHLHGYNSDMTRTLVVGEADGFQREIYDVVLRSQLAGVEAATVGTPLVEVDAVCREIIEAAGYGDYFTHSTGHGIGLDVHEGPSAAQTGTGSLTENMTLTIEPGIYVPGRGGVRIEDTLIIGSGGPKIITNAGKDLLVV